MGASSAERSSIMFGSASRISLSASLQEKRACNIKALVNEYAKGRGGGKYTRETSECLSLEAQLTETCD